MRCPSNLVFTLAAGIIPVLFLGCSNSGSGMGTKAGSSTAGASAMGTGPSAAGGAQPDAGAVGGAGAGGVIVTGGDTGVLSSAGGKTGGAGTTVSASTTSSGGGGTSGSSNPGGSRTGGSTSATGTGGTAAAGATTVLGGAVAGTTSSTVGGTSLVNGGTTTGGTTNPGGGTGGSAATGGVTTLGGSRSGPPFPGRFVGNIDARNTIPTDFSKYWDQLTPADAGKWLAVQGVSRDTFNWNALDPMYKYAEDHGIFFNEDSFVWGYTPQAWVSSVADADMPGVIKNWMKAFCDRYPKTRLANVVSEPPPHTTPKYANAIGGGTSTTWDWIANAFKWAREACPNTILILNDYDNCELPSSTKYFIKIVKAIQALDAPIDAIGCEGHYASSYPASKFKANLDQMASETGLPIYITQFDIGTADDEKQRAMYADYFTMFWDNPNVKGVTVWGYITGATWISNSGIMSSAGIMRPAMTWLMDFLKR